MPSRVDARNESTTAWVVALAIATALAACAGPSAGTPSNAAANGHPSAAGTVADPCTSKPDEARARLTSVIEANVACSTDADCVTVEFSAACFDSCTRPMAASGQAAYAAARDEATKNECAAFAKAGCPAPEHPPCAPPAPPTCKAGVCE